MLTGIGVYLPYTSNCEALICVDARPLEKPLRPLDVETKLDSIDDPDTWGTTTIFAKVNNAMVLFISWSDYYDFSIGKKHFQFSVFKFQSYYYMVQLWLAQ